MGDLPSFLLFILKKAYNNNRKTRLTRLKEIKQMNTIKIILAESGRVADLRKDFPLYRGQFNDKLLNVLVPTSILAPDFEIQHYIGQMSGSGAPQDAALTFFVLENAYPERDEEEPCQQGDVVEYIDLLTQNLYLCVYNNEAWDKTQVDSFGTLNNIAGTNIKIGMLATKPNGVVYESKAYFMRYLKTMTYQGEEYALYERKLPKEFTSFVGQGENAPKLIINVVNIDLDTNAITSLVTSQSCALDVMQSTMLDTEEPIETSDIDLLETEVNNLTAEMLTKQDKQDDLLMTTDKTVVGAINELHANDVLYNPQVIANKNDITDIKAEQMTQNSAISANSTDILANSQSINSLNTRVTTLENTITTEETFVGRMTGTSLPTDAQLNAFVETTLHRGQQAGDVVIFVLQIAGATDKNYKYIYSGATSSWSGYEIPATEPADNANMGIVKGSYGSDKSTQVNIIGGDIKNIYIEDNSDQLRDLAEYLNTDNATLTSTASQVVTNTSDIATNTNNISTNTTSIANIINGTTTVAKATRATQDGNGNNIAQTYLTQTAGATKQQMYDYALPRAFNDVSYLASANVFSDTLPDTSDPIYTATSTSVGDTTLFNAIKSIDNAEFQLASKNSYTSTFYATASIGCTVEFRLTTEIFVDNAWVTANTEITEPITMTDGDIKKLVFSSTLNFLSSVLDIADGDKFRQKLEVITQTSETITFAIYSNSVYPSTFYLNTTSQVVALSQGRLGELPIFDLAGTDTLQENIITFTLPSVFTITDGVEAQFILSYSGTTDNNTTLVFKQGIQTIQVVTPKNFGTATNAKIADFTNVFAPNNDKWVFTGVFRVINGGLFLFADVENAYSKAQIDTLLQGKQATLTQTQLDAVNSGINSTKVAQIATNATNISTNTSDIATLQSSVSTLQTTVGQNTANISANASSITALQSTTSSLQSQVSTHTSSINSLGTRIGAAESDISTIETKIPVQASSSNQLADKAFVNSSIQTATAHFRGNWATWSAVPTSASGYPADADGNTTPTTNDYMVVQDASDYTGATTLAGTWRFKYTGVWATNGINGWQPEYQVNESPLTSAQLAALNSGATTTNIGQIATNTTNIANNTSAIGTNTSAISGLTTRMGTAEGNISTNTANIATNTGNIATNTSAINGLTTRMGTAETDIGNRVTKSSTANQVYATDNSGSQTTLTYGTGTNASLVVQRDSDGAIAVPDDSDTTTNLTNVVNKNYVANATSGLQSALSQTQIDATNSGINATNFDTIYNIRNQVLLVGIGADKRVNADSETLLVQLSFRSPSSSNPMRQLFTLSKEVDTNYNDTITVGAGVGRIEVTAIMGYLPTQANESLESVIKIKNPNDSDFVVKEYQDKVTASGNSAGVGFQTINKCSFGVSNGTKIRFYNQAPTTGTGSSRGQIKYPATRIFIRVLD